MAQTFAWFKPAPLWQENGRELLVPASQISFRQPRLLQYETDDFMERFFAQAATAASEADLPLAKNPPLQATETLKLFQPAHGRYYLVCSSLCCVQPGFPDRAIRLKEGERIFFVLRRMLGGQEWAWVSGSTNAGWQSLNGDNTRVLEGEERLPLFAAPGGNGRSLVFGYVPASSGETFAAAPATLPGAGEETGDPRVSELEERFIEPVTWVNELGSDAAAARRLSTYLLLGLWEYLYAILPAVAEAIAAEETITAPTQAAALATWFESQLLGPGLTLSAALADVASARDALNEASDDALPEPFTSDNRYSLRNQWPAGTEDEELDELRTRLEAALAEADEAAGPAALVPTVAVPKLRPDSGETYVLRCVYERPQCVHQKMWISRPTEPFRLAPFFDPDAPVRPVRVTMPDLNMSSLRRFGKGVTFVLPESLQNALEGIDDAVVNLMPTGRSLSELGIGYMCSFSIPIITICAFILLLVLVIVLHLVFWWIPFFKICLPIPRPE